MAGSPWVQGFCSGHEGVPWVPSSPQSAKLRVEGSVPYLQQGCSGCPQLCPAVAEEVGQDVTCNLPVSLPRGSAWANMVSQYTQVILLILYMWWKKIHVKTWGGTVLSSSFRILALGIWHCHQQVTKGLPSPHNRKML